MATEVEIGAEGRGDGLALAREVVFSPVADGAVVEQTVRRLGEAIGLGLIEVGERLPPEAELATSEAPQPRRAGHQPAAGAAAARSCGSRSPSSPPGRHAGISPA